MNSTARNIIIAAALILLVTLLEEVRKPGLELTSPKNCITEEVIK